MATYENSPRDRDAAKACFEEALRQNPGDTYVLHHLGLLMLEEYNDKEQAETLMREAVKSNPDNFAAWTSLGCIEKNRHNFALAHECFDRALAVRPDYSRALKNRGLLLELQGQYVDSKATLEAALKADPANASVYLTLGQLLQSHFKDSKAAERCYEGAIQADPENPQGYVKLGVLRSAVDDNAAAKSYFESALRRELFDTKTLVKYAQVLDKLQEKTAVHAFALAHENAPDYLKYKTAKFLRGALERYAPEYLEARKAKGVVGLPSAADVVDGMDGLMINVMVPSLSSDGYEGPKLSSLRCPRSHLLLHVRRKPTQYRPMATWACEECKLSIGGPELRVHGAYYCDTCKYDVCYRCSERARVAHIFPSVPKFLGHGGNGEVWQEFVSDLGGYYAVKHIPLVFSAGVRQEVKLMQMFQSNPHIVRVLRYESDKREARIIMELADSSVADFVRKRGALHERDARRLLRGALWGLKALHSATPCVVHRDIKPDNLLLFNKENDVKLADFGISKAQAVVTAMQTATGNIRGTPQYLPPECFQVKPTWTPAADVWAVGCTWVHMLTGLSPYDGLIDSSCCTAFHVYNALWTKFASPTLGSFHPAIPSFVSSAAAALILRCFERNPCDRITVEQLLADPYFVSPSDAGQESSEAYALRAELRRAETEKQPNDIDAETNTTSSGTYTCDGHTQALLVSDINSKPGPSPNVPPLQDSRGRWAAEVRKRCDESAVAITVDNSGLNNHQSLRSEKGRLRLTTSARAIVVLTMMLCLIVVYFGMH